MSEGIEINKTELEEMARVILCEIYSAEKAQRELADSDVFGRTNRADYSFDNGLGGFVRQRAGFEDIGGFQRQFDNSAIGAQFNPRMSRREFLEQRSERLKQREGTLKSAFFTMAEAEGGLVKQASNASQEDLPEKLSDIFCRDARRYNGTFERY